MTQPSNLAAKIKAVPMNPTVLATDPQLAYLLSFSQHPISHDSLCLYPRQNFTSPLQSFQFVDFEQSAFEEVLEENQRNFSSKIKQVVKGIRCGFKEFYARVAANTYSSTLKYLCRQKANSDKKWTLAKEEQEYRIDALKGNSPSKWPECIKDFLKQVNALPWHAFVFDSQIFMANFVEAAKTAITNYAKTETTHQHFKPTLLLQIQALLAVVLRTANQAYILQQILFIDSLKKYPRIAQIEEQLTVKISQLIRTFFTNIPQENTTNHHYPESLWNKQPFLIMKKKHFQKYNGLAYYSIATDGSYLYFYISAINGGMFKIGTGQNGTQPGKIYLEQQINLPIGSKADEVSWVYLKGKLYLKASSRDPWILDVINPETFQFESSVQLFCPSLFGHQSLINLNKNAPILTDGTNLYYLGCRIKISKCEAQIKNEKQQEKNRKQSHEKAAKSTENAQEKKPNQPNQNQKKNKRKNKKNDQAPGNNNQQQKHQNFQKVLEIVLYSFSVDTEAHYDFTNVKQSDVQELFDSFSGYFTKDQCKRALVLNHYDLADACQWLFNQGEKEKDRGMRILQLISSLVVAQSQITSNFQQKAIKGTNQITTKQGSLLFINNLFESIWTMDKEQLTCYSETSVKIFSKDKTKFKVNPETKLGSTLVKTYESKFPRNPQYTIIYDPYNCMFYTFAWPQDGHYFPTIVLLSNDRKKIAQLKEERRFNAEVKDIHQLDQLLKYTLHHMNLLDKSTIKAKYRYNDWSWFYGQKVLDITAQLTANPNDKNRLSNKKTKVMGKLSKTLRTAKVVERYRAQFQKNNKVRRQIVKIYPFDSDGSSKNYEIINVAFTSVLNHPEQTCLYILCLQNWLLNCSSTPDEQTQKCLNDMGEKLLQIKTKCAQENRIAITRVLSSYFYLFFRSAESQINFLVNLSNDEMARFIGMFESNDHNEKQSFSYELTNKDHLIDDPDKIKGDLAQIFKSKSQNLPTQINSNHIGYLLLHLSSAYKDVLDSTIKKNFSSFIQHKLGESLLGSKLLQLLFLSSLKLLNQLQSSDFQKFIKQLEDLLLQVFRIYDRVIPRCKGLDLLTLLPTLLLSIQIYHASLLSVNPKENIAYLLIRITQSLQRQEYQEAVKQISQIQLEGISPTSEKVYETSHPVQRGKNCNFPARSYPGASAILLDLDYRCQSDSNSDTLNIQLLHEDSPVGNNININDGVFYSHLRLSGAVDTKKPYLLLGQSVVVDFNSSGQVKDTQSLIRYGFKIGLRPVYAGKLSILEPAKSQIIKTFQNIQNYYCYLHTLKFLIVCTSNTLEYYLSEKQGPKSQRISEILKGKIFRQGFQDQYKIQNLQSDENQKLNLFLKRKEQESHDKAILKHNHEGKYSIKQQQPIKPVKEELWNFQGVPTYIRSYLQQIKSFKGDFIEVFSEARQLAKQKGTYAHILRKKTFLQNHKQFWLQGEAILFLTILKHSGLLHLNLKFSIEYIKGNLKAFEDARDGIYYAFISRINNVNQWRDLCEIYLGKRQEEMPEVKEPVQEEVKKVAKEIQVKRQGKNVKAKVIEKEIKKAQKVETKVEQKPQNKRMNKIDFEKHVRERLSQNDSLVKGICLVFNLPYDSNNHYEAIGNIIEHIISNSDKPLSEPNWVYAEPIQHLIRCCLFLLKFKSPSTKQSLQSSEDIVPVNISRSLSSDNRNVDTNKVNIFREWLENWKKWKCFKKEGEVQLKFPVEQIVKYINSWIDYHQIDKEIRRRHKNCLSRTAFYTLNSQLLKALTNSPLIRYALGAQALNLNSSYQTNLSSVNEAVLKQLEKSYLQYQSIIKQAEQSYRSQLPLSLTKFNEAIKGDGQAFLEKIKLLCHPLLLLECENTAMDLSIALYLIPLRYLDTTNETIIYLTNLLIQKAFLASYETSSILDLIQKEVGRNSIAFRRWKDYFFIERLLFLLRKLEINIRRTKTTFPNKARTAELLFYILYHLDVPLVSRISIRILNSLNINLKQGIRTPLDYEYQIYVINDCKQIRERETFYLIRTSKNNLQLLCEKINNTFSSNAQKELEQRYAVQQVKHIKEGQEQKFNIIVNLYQEEDLYWLIKTLYYIDQLEVKLGEKVMTGFKDWEDYLSKKNKKKDQMRKEVSSIEPEVQKLIGTREQSKERIFSNLPKYTEINPQIEASLPIGWFFNYCNVFKDGLNLDKPVLAKAKSVLPAQTQMPIQPPQNMKQNKKNQGQAPNQPNQNRKIWNGAVFTKLSKKYEQFNSKPLQEPKEADSVEIKQDFVKAKNFFNRIRRYILEISVFTDNFARNGYIVLREDVPKTKMVQLCQLLAAGSSNRLRDIDIDIKNAEVKGRLNFNECVPNFTTRMKITLIKNKNYALFQQLIALQSAQIKDASYPYQSINRSQLTFEDSKAYMPYEDFPTVDDANDQEEVQFGKQWIESHFSRMKKKNEQVYLYDYPNQSFYICQGGIESGLKDSVLISSSDSSLTVQSCPYEKVMNQPKFKPQQQTSEMPEDLIGKIQQILGKGQVTIENEYQIKQYLLLCFYLRKLKLFDLQLIDKKIAKEFAENLFKFTQNLHSYKELEMYKEDMQKLVLKLVDNKHEPLHLFATYLPDDNYQQEVEEYLSPLKLQKLNSSNEVKQQSLQTHSYPRSRYLLKSQPPQIQQNKLLKYWEKSILPKILQFVKTTLKPLEIEDFWEQMRRPLRIGDHTEAKRVAFIICDNKLPAGAVMPDSNHNWNSLEIEDLQVGEDVLIKLPKQRADFWTPLLGWNGQEQRLAKVVFIDTKNSLVLVRYRVQELALLGLAWIPVNSLMAAQKEVMHISTRGIYEQLQKKIQGMIYIYAKDCLTKLSGSVASLDNVRLIKQTVLDLFLKNPISGCFQFPKPQWAMQSVFVQMLHEGNLILIDELEKQFCSIKGIDLNLNCEKMTQLNRFDEAKALIVTFKKDAKLAQCSGIRFYSDKYGYNEVAHIYTAKAERTQIQPVQFNQPNIFCKYYTNKQCLPIVQQNNYKVYPVQATVFAVDGMWVLGTFLGQKICDLALENYHEAYLPVLQRLNRLFVKWILKRSVSTLCCYMAKLIAKISLTISLLQQRQSKEVTLETFGITSDQIKDLLGWINALMNEQSKQVVALYSSLLQNLSEMAACILVKLPNAFNPPQYIKSQIDLIKMFRQIDNFMKTKKLSLGLNLNIPNYQWERILSISNIPSYISKERILASLQKIIEENKGKLLCPAYDIHFSDNRCFILVDGWDITELIEEEVIQKIQQEEEEEKQPEEEQTGLMTWVCPACTYQNPIAFPQCDMCQAAQPIVSKPEEVYDVVEATDLKAAERHVKEKEAKRFEEVKSQILKYFQNQYKAAVENLEKKNKETEEKVKGKDMKKVKKEEKQQAQILPEKPSIKIETGSALFNDPAIESFLNARLSSFPAQLKKLVEDQDTGVSKFKKFFNLGYDFWGDNIYSENATLIQFSSLYLLMDYVQTQICKGSSSVLSYSEESIRILSHNPLVDQFSNNPPINYLAESDSGVRVKYKSLAMLKSYNVRFSWKVVKQLNLAASKCLQFVNMDLKFDKERNDTCPHYTDPLGYKLKYFRSLIMGVIKLELFQKIMQKTSVVRENDEIPRIYLERLKIREQRTKQGPVSQTEKDQFLFTKSHDQFLKMSPAFLRPFKPKGTDPYLSFHVTFKGENVMGEAGPYRQFFTDIGRQLEPAFNLGLFVPSPNNKHQSGQHKSRWVINTKANSSYHYSLFEFVGVLMGCCLRTGGHLTLDLPSLFWKSLVHQQINDQDLQQVDVQLVQMIKMLRQCPSQQAFIQAMDATNGGALSWTYRTFHGQVEDLIPNGKQQIVEFCDLHKYIEALKLKKINEMKPQIKRILKGLSDLIPLPYLHCLTGQELKLAICGRPRVDVQLLKKHTKYSGGLNDDSRRIKFFWEMMRQLDEVEKLKIIRFCWGQERLPVNSQEFERGNIRFMIKPMIADIKDQDQALPKADTCFFNIELPDYSTKAIMRYKILIAINFDRDSINGDNNAINNEYNPNMNELNNYNEEGPFEEQQ